MADTSTTPAHHTVAHEGILDVDIVVGDHDPFEIAHPPTHRKVKGI